MSTVPSFRRTARRLRRSRHVWFSSRVWRRRVVFWAGAVVTGYIAAGFAIAANKAQDLFRTALGPTPLLALLITPAALALSCWLAARYFPNSQGSGIPQAIAARHMVDIASRNKLLSLRISAGKILLCLIGLLGGASIGREGPTVQVGASIMLWFGKMSNMGREPGLILAGSAAGVAAAFNTPLAGIVFAIEEMSRAYEQRINSLVLIAVVLAGIASISVLGNHTYFGATSAGLDAFRDWSVVAIMGIVGGFAGGLFSQGMLALTRILPAIYDGWVERNPVYFAAGCGLVLAILGLSTHGMIYGTGYEQANAALNGSTKLGWIYAPLKLMATLISSIAGIPGGLFAPSLSVGAGIGSAMAYLFPNIPIGAVVLLGMVGYFAGVVQAPITAFVIVMEMSADQAMLIPLMATSVIAYGLSRLVCREPLYHALAVKYLSPALAAAVETT